MSGILIQNDEDRIFLCRMVMEAKPNTLVEMRVDPATDPQKKRMWAMLGEIARKVPHVDRFGNERYYAPEQWRTLLMFALGQEVEFMPSLDGSTFIPYDGKSSKMNKADMQELLAFIDVWGTQNGVEFKQ